MKIYFSKLLAHFTLRCWRCSTCPLPLTHILDVGNTFEVGSTLCTVTNSRVCVRLRRQLVDAAQSAATQHVENRDSVVRVSSSTAPDARWHVDDGLTYCSTRQICQGSRYSPWFISVDADTRHTSCIQLLCSSTLNSQNESVHLSHS